MQSANPRKFDRVANRILTGTIIFALVLVGIYWFDALNGNRFPFLHSLFDLDGEGNIPAWFSSAQLMLIAVVLWTRALRRPRGVHPSKAFFFFAGGAAMYASMDETAQIHETVTAWLGRRYVDWLPHFTVTHFWILMVAVAIIMTLIQTFAYDLTTIWREHRHPALIGVLGTCIGLGGAIGVETIGYKLLHGVTTTLWYKAEVTLEEFMEMLGASLILFATLKLNGALAAKRSLAARRAAGAAGSGVPKLAGASSR